MKFHSFQEVNHWLHQFVPQSLESAYTLERMVRLMKLLGDPQETYKIIHVAGTSGKTSTSYYISKLLELSGKKVGLTVSPHLNEVNDRLQINTLPVNEQKYCKLLGEFSEISGVLELQPTYFELLVALAFWAYAKEKVDYAVVEVGLGGLIDGTNVISRTDKVAVITDIGLDHTHILGDTVQKIASQKAGIIFPGNHAFMLRQLPEVIDVFDGYAKRHDATLHVLDILEGLPDYLPSFQQRNWSLAKQVYDFVATRDGLAALTPDQIFASQQFQVPGRMEVLQVRGKKFILDGAHNSDKFKMLSKSLVKVLGDEQPLFIVGLLSRKEMHIRAIADLIARHHGSAIVSRTEDSQDLPHRWVPAKVLTEACRRAGVQEISTAGLRPALTQALESRHQTIVITGSLYLLAEARGVLLSL